MSTVDENTVRTLLGDEGNDGILNNYTLDVGVLWVCKQCGTVSSDYNYTIAELGATALMHDIERHGLASMRWPEN